MKKGFLNARKALMSLALAVPLVTAGLVTGVGSVAANAVDNTPTTQQCVVNVIHHPEVSEVDESRYSQTTTIWTVEHKKVRSTNAWTDNELTWLGTHGSALDNNEWQLNDSVVNGAGINPLTLPQKTWTSLPGGLGAYGGPSSNDVQYFILSVDISTTQPASGSFVKSSKPVTVYYVHGGNPTDTLGDSNWTTDVPDGWTLVDTRVKTAHQDAYDENVYGDCPVNKACTTISDGGTATPSDADGWVNYDTRSAGHAAYVTGGLHIFTDDASTNAKVSWAHALSIPLSDAGTLARDYTATTGIAPGLNLFVTFGGDGNGTLVQEDVYGQDLWLTSGSPAAVKANAPVDGGGNGSEWHGTINQWLTKYPTAHINGFAFAEGSGVHADGVLHSVTVGCTLYQFGAPSNPGARTYDVPSDGEPTCLPEGGGSYIHSVEHHSVTQKWDESSQSFVDDVDSVTGTDHTTITIPAGTNVCPTTVEPVAPSATDFVCTSGKLVPGSYTIPDTTGLVYLNNGTPIAAGTYPAKSGEVLNLTVQVLNDTYQLDPKYAETPWTFHKEFSVVAACLGQTTLAMTGSDIHTILTVGGSLLAAGVVLVAIVLPVIRRRRRQTA